MLQYIWPLFYFWVGPEGAKVDFPCRNSPSGVDLQKVRYSRRGKQGQGQTNLWGPLKCRESLTMVVSLLKTHN